MRAGAAPHAVLVPLPVGGLALGALGDRGHHLDGAHRVGAHGGLLGEHQGVGAVEDRVGHVGDLGARGPRRGDHRLEHLSGRDDRPGERSRETDDLLLDEGHVLDPQLDPEVAAGHHHAVGGLDDRLGVLDRLGLLDLRDQGDVGMGAKVGDLLGPPHEAERHQVHADLLADPQPAHVVLGHRG